MFEHYLQAWKYCRQNKINPNNIRRIRLNEWVVLGKRP
jgi:hypothetical protein